MNFEIAFADEAIETFNSIIQQLQIKWGQKEVKELKERAFKVIDLISKFPLIFPAVNINQDLRKAFIHKNCSMF